MPPTQTAIARRTAVLAVLRGALLDLLATGDIARTTDAVHAQVRDLRAAASASVVAS